jgi:signal transduction histidine kinase/CheY-like chemotaxis protein/chemotaxis regulatin CheY-phosphate phosphatase CheZ
MLNDSATDGQELIDILEASPIGAVILDRSDRVLFWNTPLLDILGGLQGDEFAMAAASAFFAEPRDFEAAKQKVNETGSASGIETRLARADGLESWASISLRTITFEGQPATLVWYFDITQNQLRQTALELSQETLLEVLDASPFGVALTDGPGRVAYWNMALMQVLGAADSADPSAAIREAISQATDTIVQMGEGHPFQLEDGRWVTAWRRQVLFEGRPAGLVWLHDVTDLRAARDEAERATRTKSAFLATMSHEIRTPMNGVRTMAELLSDTALSKDQAQMVTIIKDSADALVTVINDVLDISKIEAGKLEITAQPFQVQRVVDGVIQLLRPKAEEKGLLLQLQVIMPGQRWVLGDDMRLRQILLNLIGNGIKFTERGTVSLKVTGTGNRVRFDITDSGIGIPPETMQNLFRPFAQADASTARKFGGTGLGLSICKGLMDLMGGAIGVDSEEGRGSTFWIMLPLPETEAPAGVQATDTRAAGSDRWRAPNRDLATASGAIVLCAEDNPTNREVLGRVLDRLGIVYDMAVDGADALRQLDRSRHGLLLTDGHMPGIDGWELTSRIRATERADGLPRLPVVALTADAIRGVEEKCMAFGMDGYLTKPLVVKQVEDVLLKNLPALQLLRTPLDSRADGAGAVFAVESHVLDLAVLTDMVGDDAETITDLLQSFLESATGLLSDAIEAAGSQDMAQVRAVVHSLKGAARSVGARKLAETAASVEQAAAENRPDEVRRWMPALRPLFDEVGTAIERRRAELELRQIRMEIGEMADQGSDVRAGSELEAVVNITEAAADRILQAAETILTRVELVETPGEAEAVRNAVMAIFEACSFQDLTSQRVRKAVARLSDIEDRLEAFVRGDKSDVAAPARRKGTIDQDDVDAMFG